MDQAVPSNSTTAPDAPQANVVRFPTKRKRAYPNPNHQPGRALPEGVSAALIRRAHAVEFQQLTDEAIKTGSAKPGLRTLPMTGPGVLLMTLLCQTPRKTRSKMTQRLRKLAERSPDHEGVGQALDMLALITVAKLGDR
jgi:hypothetical protein